MKENNLSTKNIYINKHTSGIRKYGLLVPVILTILLEFLKYIGYFKYSWFWVISPIWIWIGGFVQLFIAAFIFEVQKELEKNK